MGHIKPMTKVKLAQTGPDSLAALLERIRDRKASLSKKPT
jgi:hypothetical protein